MYVCSHTMYGLRDRQMGRVSGQDFAGELISFLARELYVCTLAGYVRARRAWVAWYPSPFLPAIKCGGRAFNYQKEWAWGGEIASHSPEALVCVTLWELRVDETRASCQSLHSFSLSPPAEEYVSIVTNTSADFTFSCDSDCINGTCIPPGLCGCNAGWRGEDCSIGQSLFLSVKTYNVCTCVTIKT